MTDSSDSTILPLIARAQSGDGTAIGSLLERYRPYLQLVSERAIGPALRKRLDAVDLVQQTFLEASRDVSKFRGSSEGEFSVWLRTILERNISNAVRDNKAAMRDVGKEQTWGHRQHSTIIVWLDPAADTHSPSQRVIEGERALRVAAALMELPDDQREAVRLRHLEGWKFADIAEHMNRSLPATAGLIKRGLKRLSKEMAGISG